MFGVTILGIWIFRFILVRLNRQLETAEAGRVGSGTGPVELGETGKKHGAQEMRLEGTGFRYLV